MFERADLKVIIFIMLMAVILAATFALAYYYLINRPEYPEGTYETIIDGQTIVVESDPRQAVKIISTPGPEATALPVIDPTLGTGDGVAVEPTATITTTIIVVTPLPTTPPPPPPTVPPPTPVPPSPVPKPNQYTFIDYLVVQGDTLWSISQKHNTTIALMARFGIDATDIVPGTTIRLPVANPAYCPGNTPYVVEEGDTLSSIARKCGTTVATLVQLNNMNPNSRLDATQVICVPK